MTDYILQPIMGDIAKNAILQDYTDRVESKKGNSVIASCSVTSQVTDGEYPRYEITWKTRNVPSQGHIWAKYTLKSIELQTPVELDMRVKILHTDTEDVVREKLTNLLGAATLEAKRWYDENDEPWHEDYVDPNAEPAPEPIEIDHSVSLVEVGSIDLLDTEEAPVMILEEYVVSDADVDESEEWTGFYGLPDFANWIDFEIIKMHSDAPQAAELSKIFGTTIDLARSGTFHKNIYIKIGGAACYGEAELQYFQGWGFYVSMKSINYFVGDPEAVAGDDLFLASAGNIYAIEE